MTSSTAPVSIAIIGSGIGGIALAIGLRKQNVPCTIFESAPRFDAVGAGIGLGPNSLKAMGLMDEKFAELYDNIKVGNTSPERKHEQIEILSAEEGFVTKSGWTGGSVGHADFTRSSAHRKALLEVMKSLISEDSVRFNKRVVSIDQSSGQKVTLTFLDGESLQFDAVIGCDGIKGMTRSAVLESRYPEEIRAKYCNAYVYRGIAPMEEAEKIIGSYAADARWYMSEERGWSLYPISNGTEVNLVAFIHDKNAWVGEQAAREVPRDQMVAEFVNFDSRLRKLVDYLKPMQWPLFHHPDTPTYYNGRLCMLGDAAHASTPSQAAGAGQGLEDALILSKILGLVKNPSQVESAFQVYDSIRRPRAQGVVRDSLEVMNAYFLIHPDFGHDLQKLTDEANKRLPLVWFHDLEADMVQAEKEFNELNGVLASKAVVEEATSHVSLDRSRTVSAF